MSTYLHAPRIQRRDTVVMQADHLRSLLRDTVPPSQRPTIPAPPPAPEKTK